MIGYCQANSHFFSISSVYATERPDKIDAALVNSYYRSHVPEYMHRYSMVKS